MDKKFFLVNNDNEFSFDQVCQMIKDGKIVKDTFIWEKSLPEWIKIKDYNDFSPIFLELEKEAEKHMKKALGTDEESVKKKEMKEFLGTLKDENESEGVQFHADDEKKIGPGLIVFIIIILLGSLGGAYFFMTKDSPPEKRLAKQPKKVKIDDINLDNLKFSSGVTKLDKVKGLKIKKIKKSEEDKILMEALLEQKREEAELAEKKAKKEGRKIKKKASIFDQVSDNELAAFRKSLTTRSSIISKSSLKSKKSGFMDIKPELTSKQVGQVVKRYSKSTVGYCYNKSLKQDTSLSGKLEVTLKILGNGKVSKVITNTKKFKGTNMSRCITTQIKKKWKFPPFKSTVMEVTLPFVLSN